MSIPLKDYRTKIPVETLAIIKGYASAFKKDEQEIGREVLNEWAEKIAHANKVAQAHLKVAGLTGHPGE
jgi:hypothetical protein